MKKNVIMIETEETMGTGILYPCKYETDEIDEYQSFIIFTNRHVLGEIGKTEMPEEDIKDYILLKIYDDYGKMIEPEEIKRVLVHNVCRDIYHYNDIAALLVCINESVSLHVDVCVYEEELKNRDTLFMEGYPGIMMDDMVCQRVQLQGMAKDMFPVNEKIGMYQIKDDYHWYNNMRDLKLMEGFSGSPVYIEREQKKYLVGMNQSVADVSDGENPFKLVYYLKMKHVIARLRETGCILFRKERNGSYQIEWVYGFEDKVSRYKNDPAFLLIGGSGAGKSSFAKDFAYHGINLETTNDGQTTRTNVLYEYSIFCDEPKAEVKFFTKDEFCKHMERMNGVKPMIFLFENIFGIAPEQSGMDELFYLRNCYYFLEELGKHNPKSKLFNQLEELVLEQKRENDWEVRLSELYREVISCLLDYVLADQVRYICDKGKVEKVRKLYKDRLEYQKQREQAVSEWQKQEVFEAVIKDTWGEGLKEIEEGVKKCLYDFCQSEENDAFKTYQTQCYSTLKNRNERSVVNQYNRENYAEKIASLEFKEALFEQLFNVEGFFHLSEFDFIMSSESVKKSICEQNLFLMLDKRIQKEDRVVQIDIAEDFEKVYGAVHEEIKKALIEKDLVAENNLTFTLLFSELKDADKKELLTCCLQMKDGRSLTGIVKSVKITDRISDEYALLLNDMKIKRLRILDTCGLDHVERNGKIKETLQRIIECYEKDEKITYKEYSILYLKKLDSGRPDELRGIIPLIYEVIPQVPIYVAFSGIDIFYHNDTEMIRQIQWRPGNEKDCPKAVHYLLAGKKELTEKMECSEERKRNLYLVLVNNLLPYCGSKELVKSDYNYYENNLKYFRRVLSSIIRKEYSSLEIVNVEMVKDILEEKSKGDCNHIAVFLEKVFEKASVRSWRIHHMTVKANYYRITKRTGERELGYWRTYRQEWHQLFYDAYVEIVNQESRKIAEWFTSGKDAIEAALVNMITGFLGPSEGLTKVDYANGNEFRENLKKMYHEKADDTDKYIYKYDPFEDINNESREKYVEEEGPDSLEKKREFLGDVTDFAKGFRQNKSIRDEFVEIFKRTLVAQLEEDNLSKAESLVAINTSFREELTRLKKEFVTKYHAEEDDVAEEMFQTVMKLYFDRDK